MALEVLKPAVEWHPWQARLWADEARVAVVNWHRQAGKDFGAAGKAVDHALRTGQAWYIVSITQRQADATFAKCKTFAKLLSQAARRIGEITLSDREYVEWDREINQQFACTARTLTLPGGGSVTALPGRDPDTLAGLTGNVIFTEFGLFPRGGYDHWRVVFPLATRGYRVIVISTPRGKNTKFYELSTNPDQYSYHFQPITRSVDEGFVLRDNAGRPCTLEAFRALYGDEAGWRREYMCEFTGDLDALVRWSLLEAAGEAGRGKPFDLLRIERGAGWKAGAFAALRAARGRPEIGWDVARHKHFSPLWVNLSCVDSGPRQLRFLVLMHECEFALQRAVVIDLMTACPNAVGFGDATGLGMDSNEQLASRFGDRWKGIAFTSKSKREMGSLLATAYGDGDQAIPPVDGEHKYIATDIYAIQKEGDIHEENLTLAETDNPLLPDSHCDIAYACALARKARQTAPAAFAAWSV